MGDAYIYRKEVNYITKLFKKANKGIAYKTKNTIRTILNRM